MRRLVSIGGLSLVVVGVFGAGYTLRDLARGITEAPSHWWSTAPWIGIVLGVGLLVLARISQGRQTASLRERTPQSGGGRNPDTGRDSQ
jgi:hypothetical protein